MCKTTKGSQTASRERLRTIRPNTAGGPNGAGTGSGASGPLLFDGVPEHVPDLTFIVQARAHPDDFIDGATTYHTNCGLGPVRFTSIENLVQQLAASTAHIGRMRIVTHAHPTNLATAMFENSNVFHANKEFIRGFARGDIEGLLSVLFMDQRHFLTWSIFTITSQVRTSNAALLAPFGFNTSGAPSGALQEFIFFSADQAFITTNHVTRNSAALNATQRNNLRNAFRQMAQTVAATLVGTTMGGHVIAQGDLDALGAAVAAFSLSQLGFASGSFDFQVGNGPEDIDPFPLVGAAVGALQRGLRANINTVRGRFNQQSWIDIRGCRAGQDTDYLVAMQEFFGPANHAPHVTAPRWFQFFGSCAFSNPNNNAAIHTLLTAGADAALIRDGCIDWAQRTRVDSQHKPYWNGVLTGNIVQFCKLEWRTQFPAIPLQTPGLTDLAGLAFNAVIPRIQELFNVPAASTPSGAPLATLNTFVTGQLAGWMNDLLAKANSSTPAAQLTTLFNSMKAINTALGQSLVPATAPSPLRPADITGYQNALIGYLEAHQLQPLRQFLTAANARANDTGDPGLAYYMLQIGIPIFIFAPQEQLLAGHGRVQVTHNRLIVLNTRADAEYRQWPQLLWAEPLPASNTIGALHPNAADARRFAMMVESADGPASTTVASCPHPDYMSQVASVP